MAKGPKLAYLLLPSCIWCEPPVAEVRRLSLPTIDSRQSFKVSVSNPQPLNFSSAAMESAPFPTKGPTVRMAFPEDSKRCLAVPNNGI